MDDCGGGYSESIAEMCDELMQVMMMMMMMIMTMMMMQGHVNILIQTPNGRDEAGTSRDCMLLHPSLQSPQHSAMFRFLKMMMMMR